MQGDRRSPTTDTELPIRPPEDWPTGQGAAGDGALVPVPRERQGLGHTGVTCDEPPVANSGPWGHPGTASGAVETESLQGHKPDSYLD